VLFTAMLPGERFPNAPDRFANDSFVPLSRRLHGQEYSQQFLSAVDWALKVRAEQRPQNISSWREALESGRYLKLNGKKGGGPGFFSRLLQPGFWLELWKKHPLTVILILTGAIFLTAAIAMVMFLPND
jgi:hypothetical protein